MSGASRLLLARQGESQFLPSQISDLHAWYDASEEDSLTYSSGVLVSDWADLSSNGRDLSQADTDFQPSRNGTIGSRDAIEFTNHYLWRSLASPIARTYVAFVVADVNPGASGATGIPPSESQICSFRSSSGGNPITAQIGSGSGAGRVNVDDRTDTAFLRRIGSASWGDSESKLITVIKNGVSLGIYNEGGTRIAHDGNAGTGSATVDRFSVGGHLANDTFSNNWIGAVGEIILYSDFIGFSDINKIGIYLANRWGFSWSTITA